MNKILLGFAILLSGALFASAVVVGDSDNNGIRDDVDAVISQIKNQYSLTAAQVSSINQVARSQQYILSVNPQTRDQAVEVAKRDTAAVNCAGTRLPGSMMDMVYTVIEATTFNTTDRQAVENYYNSLLGEDDNVTPVVVAACEDSFSAPTPTPQVNNYLDPTSSYTPSGIVSDKNISSSCTVITQFMEYGSRATQVLTLQKFLSDNGYMEMWPTGYFGRNTEAAVRLWQSRHGVDVRGWVGPNTRGSIAAVTCRGDSASIQRAVRGVSMSYVTPKKTVYVPSPVVATPQPVAPPVTDPVTPTYSTAKLSSSAGTFYTRRNPVNALYVTYKTDTASPTTICFEKSNDTNCSNPDNFVTLQSQYRPGSYDAIPNGDRWILNFYYNAGQWANGGKVYLKSSSGIADVYSIRVSDTQ